MAPRFWTVSKPVRRAVSVVQADNVMAIMCAAITEPVNLKAGAMF
jgi:hypothetical protein